MTGVCVTEFCAGVSIPPLEAVVEQYLTASASYGTVVSTSCELRLARVCHVDLSAPLCTVFCSQNPGTWIKLARHIRRENVKG